jgi:hypothetical protein
MLRFLVGLRLARNPLTEFYHTQSDWVHEQVARRRRKEHRERAVPVSGAQYFSEVFKTPDVVRWRGASR